MFKLICDLTKQYYGAANETGSTILKYDNCKPCATVSYKLTSSSNDNSLSIAQKAVERWNMNGLNPANPAYRETYNKLLPKEDLSTYKYIGLFEDNNNQITMSTIGVGIAIPIYESIYNGDEKIWNKASYLQFSTSVTLQPGIFEQKETKEYSQIDTYFLSYIRENGWNECDPMIAYSGNSYDHYLDNLRNQVKNTLIKGLSSPELRMCRVGDDNIAMTGSKDAQEDVKIICHQMGGRFLSTYEVYAEICKKGLKSTLSSIGNEAFKVTCDNYQETLPEIGLWPQETMLLNITTVAGSSSHGEEF